MVNNSCVYANMRIKCLEDQNFNYSDFESMLLLPSSIDRINFLKNKGWIFDDSLSEIDDILKKREEDLFKFVKELVGNLDFLNFILIKKDFSNLKAVIRGVLSEIDVVDILDNLALIKPETLLYCVKNQDFASLPDYIKDVAKESFETLLHTNDACIADTIIDSCMFKVLNEISSKSELTIVKDYVELLSVYSNCNIVLRASKLKKNTKGFLFKALIPSRTLDCDKLISFTINSEESLIDYLNGLSFSGFLLFFYREDENYLESWFDASLLNIIKKGQNNYFSRSPIVAYVLLKYLEFKRVRIVFSSEECSESELIKIKERLKAA